jgi:hypothetical protein
MISETPPGWLRSPASGRMKTQPGPPMTLGNAAAARVRLIVWCKDWRHQVEPDPAEMAARYGAETPVLDCGERLVCSGCGSQQAGMLVSGTRQVDLVVGVGSEGVFGEQI